MKKRTAWVLVSAVVAVSLGAAAVGAVALLLRGGRPRTPFTSAHSYLALNLSGDLPEEPPSAELPAFFERRPASVRTLVESLERAAGDPRIKSVVLRTAGVDAGFGKVQELRDALLRFRKSGKTAYAHLEFAGNKEFYLASACDKVYAVPTALLDITGLAAEVTFYKGTFDKLGVEAQFVGVGKYKNAPNQYTEKGFTAPHREQMEGMLDSLYGQYVAALAESRHKTEAEIRALLDDGPYDGKRALEAGLVDELVYADALDERLKGATKLTPGRYVKTARGSLGFDSRPKLALVYAVGAIIPGEGGQDPFGGSYAGSDTVARALREAREDSGIRAIVLRVDSPGGSGTASDVIWREVELARKAKPVVVSMGDMAASGGYYISMGADEIVAQPGTITGSIGVFGGKFSLRGLYDKIGLTHETVLRGKNAALFSEARRWNAAEEAKVESLMVAFYDEFVEKAAQGRGKKREEIHAVAQGRVWTGQEALEKGLVDKLGGLDVALEAAKLRAKIGRGQEVSIVVLPERKGWFELLMDRQEEEAEGASGTAALVRTLPADVKDLLAAAVGLQARGPVARLPFALRVR